MEKEPPLLSTWCEQGAEQGKVNRALEGDFAKTVITLNFLL